MKRHFYTFAVMLMALLPLCAIYAQQPNLARASSGYVENKGQWDANVLFRYAGQNMTMWVTTSGLVYDMRGKQVSTGRKIAQPSKFTAIRDEIKDEMVEQHHVVALELQGASLVSAISEQPTGTTLNYFMNGNSASSAVNIPQVSTVRFADVYPGISMVMTNPNRTPRYDFHVNPGADAKAISMKLRGSDNVRVDSDGSLVIATSCGDLRHANVYAYQMIAGKQQQVACSFTAKNNIISFAVGTYDKTKPLVIDPIVYSTFIGGDENDAVNSITVHPPSGDIVAVGTTTPVNFPKTTGAYSVQVSSLEDVFVARFKPNLATAVFISYFGGTATDRAWDVVIGKDIKTPIIVCGETNSSDFPTTSGVVAQATKGMTDAFVFKMANTGDKLDFSTFFGGSSDDRAYALTVDGAGTIYFAGETNSNNFTTKVGSYRTTYQNQGDGFVTAISPAGGTIVYSTYYGGGLRDRVLDIAASSTNDNSMLITGETRSSDIPLFPVDQVGFPPSNRPNPAQSRLNQIGSGAFSDAFIAKFNDLGSLVILSTYAGGDQDDFGNAIIVDNAGAATIAGVTSSTNLPALRQIQTKKTGK
ncbi:MAG: hypothetical protein JNL32_14500, partial [Candidatus Kapabacteria bacterium]|nr:hypothetical protein [Candidatus Kapabacteria bacterium]